MKSNNGYNKGKTYDSGKYKKLCPHCKKYFNAKTLAKIWCYKCKTPQKNRRR